MDISWEGTRNDRCVPSGERRPAITVLPNCTMFPSGANPDPSTVTHIPERPETGLSEIRRMVAREDEDEAPGTHVHCPLTHLGCIVRTQRTGLAPQVVALEEREDEEVVLVDDEDP